MDPRLFYKHRGLERAAEGRRAGGGAALSSSAACARLRGRQHGRLRAGRRGRRSGLAADRRAATSRGPSCSSSSASTTTCTTSARSAPGVGFAPGTMAFAALKERAQQTERRRFRAPLPVRHGRRSAAAPLEIDARRRRRARGRPARAARRRGGSPGASSSFAGSVQARLGGVGVPRRASDAVDLGAVGPVGPRRRLREDIRTASPRPRLRRLRARQSPATRPATSPPASRMRAPRTHDASFELLDHAC